MGDENRNYEDRQLEALLRARADAEPRSGLEERVLARIASEPTQRVFMLWPTFAAITALAVIALALIVLHTETPKQHSVGQAPRTEKPVKPSQDEPSLQASLERTANNPQFQKHRRDSRDAHRGNGNEEQFPKLATFPAPRPETEQERMLSRLAAEINGLDGSEDSTDVAQLQNFSVSEFNIHPMEVEPPVNDSPQQ